MKGYAFHGKAASRIFCLGDIQETRPVPRSANHKKGWINEILAYRGMNMVVDTASDFVYLGKLYDVNDHFIRLTEADVHDRGESPSMNEKYVIDAKKYGIRSNRKLVLIRLEKVLSFSLLEDIVEY